MTDIPADVREKATDALADVPFVDAEWRLTAERHVALALLTERREAEQRAWQPRETMPRDGLPFLMGGAGWVCSAYFEEHDGCWYEVGNHWTDYHGGPIHNALGWQPLPAPPAQPATAETGEGK